MNWKVTYALPLLLILVGCGESIIYDEHNPDLHGKTIIFKKPMVYVVVKKNDDFFNDETKKYSRWLLDKDSAYGSGLSSQQELIEIDNDTNFKIVKSYWVRQGFIENPFSEEAHYLVLQDEKGYFSVSLISALMNTDLREFAFPW